MRAVTLPALVLLAALSACGGAKHKGPERKTAAGEVLGGSISDEMLPLDTVQSQNPPLRTGASEGDEGAGSDTPTDDAAAPSAKPPVKASASAPAKASASAPAAPASASASPGAGGD